MDNPEKLVMRILGSKAGILCVEFVPLSEIKPIPGDIYFDMDAGKLSMFDGKNWISS
jgi:hypothetical protein